jgi:hypothetical protein
MDLSVITVVHSRACFGLILMLYILCLIYAEVKQGILLWQAGTWEVRSAVYYVARRCNSLPTFQDNLSVPSSMAHNPRSELDSEQLKMGPISCPKKLVWNYHYAVRSRPKEHSSDLLRGGKLKFRNLVVICQISKLKASQLRRLVEDRH